MLIRPSTEVMDCLQHAADCLARAGCASHPDEKQSFLDLADRWRRIAETYQYIERVTLFLQSATAAQRSATRP